MIIVTNKLPFIFQQRNMLGDNPEHSFLGGAKIPNSKWRADNQIDYLEVP